ncbi:hypothetical protein [Brachybacterium phenoliresistens]|uniref:hypothetical protein n=1 Tax=Brachybacterium phenoliresistens TaxID=396014 RepID=UPI0031E1B7D3
MLDSQGVIESARDWFRTALASVDGPVLLTSPYLAYDVCAQVAAAAQGSPHSFVLLTTLDPSAVANGYLSVKGLGRLLEAGVEVLHAERVHAKCFLVGTRAMLGSANLTGAGLGSSASPNRELGVELSPDDAQDARHAIEAWPACVVTESDLVGLLAKSERLTRQPAGQHDDLDATTALQLAEQLLADARDPGRGLWLKLEYGEPALDGWREDSWFASPKKGRPGFRAGDLVVVCAKDTHDCYAVVEVAYDPEYRPEDYLVWTTEHDPEAADRWPWINRTRPRLVPDELMGLKLHELGVSGQGLQNGHVRLQLDQFTAGVRALARLATA